MSDRITLVSHSSTTATNVAGFPADEPLDERGTGWARAARGRLARVTRAVVSPAAAALQTAREMELDTEIDLQLRDWDLGRWRGRRLDDVAAADPDAVGAWLADPPAAPHGGESLVELLARAAGWLAVVPGGGHTVALTHPAVVRGVVLAVLGAPPAGFWRIDIAPLTATELRGGPGRWTLRSAGRHLVPRGGAEAGDLDDQLGSA